MMSVLVIRVPEKTKPAV